MTMTREDLLSAYLDGELDEAQSRDVEALLESDPSFAAELDRLAAGDRLLAEALRSDIPDDVDAATARRFGLEPVAPVAANDDRPWRRWAGVGAVAAAALALFMVVRPAPSDPWTGDRFDQAMSGTASMQQASLGEDATLTPLLSFQAADGRYCREFRLAAVDRSKSRDGIACRKGSAWTAEALVAAQPELADPSRIEVAGGSERVELDKAYDRLGAAAPMSAADERILIARDWSDRKTTGSRE